VVIAGAGPAGHGDGAGTGAPRRGQCGAECRAAGVAGSRAIVFTRRSLEILQQVGVADRHGENGLPWRFGNSIYRGQRVFRMEAPHDADDRFGPMLNIQQQFLEEYLLDACAAQPLIDLRWGNLLTAGRAAGPTTSALTVDTPAGPTRWKTDWLVAADGGRSAIRSSWA
jgi:3-(3-hydroxy-phenyl)propionate hydroxylase